MNAAEAQATFFAPFHLMRFSFVPLVSVCLFFLSFQEEAEKVVCDDEDSVLLILCQRHLLSAGHK